MRFPVAHCRTGNEVSTCCVSGGWPAARGLPPCLQDPYRPLRAPAPTQSSHQSSNNHSTPKLHSPHLGLHDSDTRRGLAQSKTQRKLRLSGGAPPGPFKARWESTTAVFPRGNSLEPGACSSRGCRLLDSAGLRHQPRPSAPAVDPGRPPPASAPAARNSGTVVPARVGNLNALARH